MKRIIILAAIVLFGGLLFFPAAGLSLDSSGAGTDGSSGQQGKIWIEEQTGSVVPLDTPFIDENNVTVTLRSLLTKPTILLPIYFYCPNSCPLNLANLAVAVDRMKLQAGKDYRVIALSFNEKETPEQARSAKRNYMKMLHDGFPEEEWKFLTGSKENIAAVLDVIGYSFKPVADGTFIHPSALVALAKDGTVIKYVYGSFIPGDVEIALVEADRGAPARSVKRLLNFCFNYDPDANKGFFQATKLIVLSLFGVLVVLFFVMFLRKKERGNSGNG